MLASNVAPMALYEIDFLPEGCSLAGRCLFDEIPALHIFSEVA